MCYGGDRRTSAFDSLIPEATAAQWRRGGQTITSASITDMSTAIDTLPFKYKRMQSKPISVIIKWKSGWSGMRGNNNASVRFSGDFVFIKAGHGSG